MGPAKGKHGVRESFAKVTFLFAKNGRSRIKEFWSTTIYIYIVTYIYMYGWINRYRNIVDDNDISLVYTVYIMSINDVHDTWLFIHIRSRPSIPNWAHICLKVYAHILNGIWDWGTKKISTPPGVVEDGAAQTWMKNSPVVGFKGVAQPPTSDA
jgi:hypothetical protein